MDTIKLGELLTNHEKYLQQTIILEGILVVELTRPKSWYLVESNSPLPLAENRVWLIPPNNNSILAFGFSAVSSVHSYLHLPYDPANPLFNYRFFDPVIMTGVIVKSEQFSTGFAIEMHEVKIVRKNHYWRTANRLIPLQEIQMSLTETITLNKNLDELLRLPNPYIRLNGVLVGNYLLNLFYVTDLDSARSLKQIRNEKVQAQSILIDDVRFIEQVKNIVSAGVGTELMYLNEIHIIGQIKNLNRSEFPIAITNITEAALIETLGILHFTEGVD